MKARINFTGELIISQTNNEDIKSEIREAIDTIILNFQEEFVRKVKEDCKKDIVFYIYDPRLTGK